MSATPREDRKPVTLMKLGEMRALGEPIVMVTAYDHPSALVAEAAGVDMVLVGDSAAMTVLGYDSTVPVTTDELLMLCRAVRRGLTTPFLVGDLPFGSYEASDEQAIETAQRFIKEAGCDAVKIECAPGAGRGDRPRGHPRDGARRASPRRPPPRSAATVPRAGPPRAPGTSSTRPSRSRRRAASRSSSRRSPPR